MLFKLHVIKNGKNYIPVYRKLSKYKWINDLNEFLIKLGVKNEKFGYHSIPVGYNLFKTYGGTGKIYDKECYTEQNAIDFINNLDTDPISYNINIKEQSRLLKTKESNIKYTKTMQFPE